jgi:hypothetical protein
LPDGTGRPFPDGDFFQADAPEAFWHSSFDAEPAGG